MHGGVGGAPVSFNTHWPSTRFFDDGDLVILLSGFQKKSQKTPKKEIKLTEKLKREYYEDR